MAKRYDPIMCMMVDEPTKARDVAPATQRYINTIVDESKANAEKFVRQAEQDDEVPENELKYVYRAYNEKFGYKFHDSASALDEAIKTCDVSNEEKDKNYNKLSKRLLRFVTMGTFKDLFEDRKEIERAYRSGSITEEHYKALQRESTEAETGIRRRIGEF